MVPSLTVREIEFHGSTRVSSQDTEVVEMEPGRTYTVGREPGPMAEGGVPIGVGEHRDATVSGQALTVSVDKGGWTLSIRNRNGAELRPWGTPARVLIPSSTGQPPEATDAVVFWPRVGVRLLGRLSSRDLAQRRLEHWILLEHNGFPYPRVVDPHPTLVNTPLEVRPGRGTFTRRNPALLTATQRRAVEAVFADYLSWPPVSSPVVKVQSSAANLVGGSRQNLQALLGTARERAAQLGTPGQDITDPIYMYALVANGYLSPDPHIN